MRNLSSLSLLIIGLVLLSPSLAYGNGAITVTNPDGLPSGTDASLKAFNLTFANGTTATIFNQPLQQEQGNLIIQLINAVINDEEIPELEELDELEEPEESIEEEDDSSGGGSSSSDDDGDDDDDDSDTSSDGDDNNENGTGGSSDVSSDISGG